MAIVSEQRAGPIATRASPSRSLQAPPAVGTRTDKKRQAIVDAATLLFLQQGYQGTNMDEIAAAAEVSKQTVYKQFTDKELLFSTIVTGITDRAERIVETIDAAVDEIVELHDGLAHLARTYTTSVVHPQVLQLRRLIISEAGHFPDLAHAYFERAPGRGLEALAGGFERLAGRKLLRIDDANTAAEHFAYLVLGPIVDKALFHPDTDVTDAEIARYAAAGVRVFVAAYT
jgi:TetR/AcrR family transcriptional repressor of mexJK operon